MSLTVPRLAVVGHPNKGKSSIVATLAEDDQVAISPIPGTTQSADVHRLAVNGEVYFELIDTPGFQRAGEVLAWLESHEANASKRPEVVARFVEAHREDPRFHDEVALLTPIVDGAGILYVVDGAKPYGDEFEIEMEILRWTGQPRMALINMIGDGDFEADWRRALDQYFSLVRVFDAMHADFDTRLGLIRACGELEERWRPAVDAAVSALEAERDRRSALSAAILAGTLLECLELTVEQRLLDDSDREAMEAKLVERLKTQVRRKEEQARQEIQRLYRHERLNREERALALIDVELFTEEAWELFGLSRTELAITGAVAGAAAGLGVDVVLGGTSLLLGSVVGAMVGGGAALLGLSQLARVEVLGSPLGGERLVVGPITEPNFPWVILGRALVHYHLIAARNHARRDIVSIGRANLMDRIDGETRRQLASALGQARGRRDGDVERRLAQLIEALLTNPLPDGLLDAD